MGLADTVTKAYMLSLIHIQMCIRDSYNIGNQNPENLLDFVQILQEELIRAGVLPEDYDFEAHKELVPMQPGDVPVTYADTLSLIHIQMCIRDRV